MMEWLENPYFRGLIYGGVIITVLMTVTAWAICCRSTVLPAFGGATIRPCIS